MSKSTQRSAQAAEYRRLYKTAAWRAIRLVQLGRTPLCERCSKLGRVTAANVVNHITPHKGSPELFYDAGNLQSLCAPCHDGEIQSRERTGRDHDTAVDASGMPIDPAHPWYGER